jgi:hypothetical protein
MTKAFGYFALALFAFGPQLSGTVCAQAPYPNAGVKLMSLTRRGACPIRRLGCFLRSFRTG